MFLIREVSRTETKYNNRMHPQIEPRFETAQISWACRLTLFEPAQLGWASEKTKYKRYIVIECIAANFCI